jgi:hypothetical protein
MRLIVVLILALFAVVGYGAYRQRTARMAELDRVERMRDSLHRADSLAAIPADSAAVRARRQAAMADYAANAAKNAPPPGPMKLPRSESKVIVRTNAATNRHP